MMNAKAYAIFLVAAETDAFASRPQPTTETETLAPRKRPR